MIKVAKLGFKYKGNHGLVVKNINFQVEKGEIFGFLGPSGAGKSTTQKVLIGLLKNYQGSVKVFDKDLGEWGKNYYEKIGVSFELPNHYQKLTALENLQFFQSLYNVRTEDPLKLLEGVGLRGDANTKVAKFSKGMQMRLNFVRALLHRPNLIFMDEPTSGIDPVNGRKIKDLILEQKSRGNTIFLTTHNMNVAEELCDRVAFIVDGEIVLEDSPQRLKIQYGQRIVSVGYLKEQSIVHEDFPMEDLGNNEHFLKLLRTEAIQTIHSKESTFEEIFIKVTGRKLI
ncbi:ABC transporter ATP-binding protein [Desulforamulus aquiferis]|uniref:ABC transporter ATP-binding protein n=1 Tax=Desulforamulus aquiferis TaxID=1397668 RepID=A0AAW7Z7B9_9FIRM|nr:ABC transporter ATP-binding protein [Desulforamulus aquiferis]MDO7785720.1 ABC transporter ATP-binding protein [Desulforamulus aquiferis]